jgi:hypothetical protein
MLTGDCLIVDNLHMKLATFTHGGRTRIGVVRGESVLDLSTLAPTSPLPCARSSKPESRHWKPRAP